MMKSLMDQLRDTHFPSREEAEEHFHKTKTAFGKFMAKAKKAKDKNKDKDKDK